MVPPPGATIDLRVSDPELQARTPVVTARLGSSEMELLTQMAMTFSLTRSSLTRRLVVAGLLQLRDGDA